MAESKEPPSGIIIPGGEFNPPTFPPTATLDQEVDSKLKSEANRKAFFTEVDEVAKPFLEELNLGLTLLFL